jgi:hypothetical protein
MFDQSLLEKKFHEIGAKVRFVPFDRRNDAPDSGIPLTIDVRTNKGKEEFEVRYDDRSRFELSVLDIRPEEKHLLLMVRQDVADSEGNVAERSLIKLLCGHDERHYFSCGIPESAAVTTVKEAKRALLPHEFIEAHRKGGNEQTLLKRKNETGFRQGEWLFVRAEGFQPADPLFIKTNEPISRGAGSKPHVCEEVYSVGGEKVYVHEKYAPNGITEGELSTLRDQLRKDGVRGRIDFQVRTRNAEVYARGSVRHPDHKTIFLPCWHRVYMNTEMQSKASKFSVFLD